MEGLKIQSGTILVLYSGGGMILRTLLEEVCLEMT